MKCPGQDSRYWKPGAIFEEFCPKCGHSVEFFKDDTARKCHHCGHRFVNPKMDFGCASYCEFAEQCIGTLPPEMLAGKEDFLKDRVAIEMKRYFKTDFKRIGHATRVARYAERIAKKETGGNMAVILCAAYLHDIGILESQRKHHPRPDENINFKVMYDADMITNTEERHKENPKQPDDLKKVIQTVLLTEAGKEEAQKVFSVS